VKRPIRGFHQDEQGHWVADLACGHGQHVRHAPPFQSRPWVLTPEGRASFLGFELDCVRCDRGEPADS
jgi:tellurite methyltransferase